MALLDYFFGTWAKRTLRSQRRQLPIIDRLASQASIYKNLLIPLIHDLGLTNEPASALPTSEILGAIHTFYLGNIVGIIEREVMFKGSPDPATVRQLVTGTAAFVDVVEGEIRNDVEWKKAMLYYSTCYAGSSKRPLLELGINYVRDVTSSSEPESARDSLISYLRGLSPAPDK